MSWTDNIHGFAVEEPPTHTITLAPGITFEQWKRPETEDVGKIHCDKFPSPVSVIRDPQLAYYHFSSSWFLPSAIESPNRFTSLKKALEAAAKNLNSETLVCKMKPKTKPAKIEKPKVLQEAVFARKGGVEVTRLVLSDRSTVYEYECPVKWDGKIILFQGPERELLLKVTELPKEVKIPDTWTSALALLRFLVDSRKQDLA
ncbi:hypothetical protein [Rhodovulum steppense]|uniref:hypothetical protein n=1 Tax=Rhodovulum steppense TaxID=540251 RepID=UPI001052652F|nr:hypothetical protein [Rhodovulum steppense]